MASSNNSINNKLNFFHKIQVDYNNNSYPITYSRSICNNEQMLSTFKIDSYYTQRNKNYVLPVQQVRRYEEYIAGCNEHQQCLGHFCITPRGTILLPQRLASTLGVMSNDFAKMAESVYIRDTPTQEATYREKLKQLMLGKNGKMRGDMPSGTVDCSAREVISLCWEIPPNHMAIPKRVANNMRVLRIEKDEETGLPVSQYSEDKLREGDWIIAVRPPSLWAGNVQPMKVVLWNHECFGLSPSNADEFHADHDGDEMQIYFIGRDESIKQCEQWKPLNEDKFQIAVEKNPLPMHLRKTTMQLRENFMVHSTLSIKELLEGEKLPALSKAARVKEPMANMMVDALKNPERTFREFSSQSIRGIRDVMAQQLNQGLLGDMSRQARLSASCVKYKGNGIFHIKASTETLRIINTNVQNIIIDNKYPLGGNPCMRAITAICSVAQQAALDSHRVSQSVSSKLDLIDNLIRGGNQSLIVVKKDSTIKNTWKYIAEDVAYCIVDNLAIRSRAADIIGAYSPMVLKAVEMIGGNIKEVCKVGLIVVCNYYGIKLSELELSSLVELFCYRVSADKHPITVKNGLLMRDMRWMTVIFANHYGKLRTLQYKGKTRKPINPETITDAGATCNFDYL